MRSSLVTAGLKPGEWLRRQYLVHHTLVQSILLLLALRTAAGHAVELVEEAGLALLLLLRSLLLALLVVGGEFVDEVHGVGLFYF